jgi:hypothetical protein
MAKGLTGAVLSDKMRLKKWDPDGDAYVVFQRPSRWEAEQLAKMQAQSELVWRTDEQRTVRQRDRTAIAVLESEQVAMCLVECNIPNEEGELLFVPGQTCRAPMKGFGQRQREGFYKVWYQPGFDPDLAEEIVDALHKFHPPFDFRSPDEGEG